MDKPQGRIETDSRKLTREAATRAEPNRHQLPDNLVLVGSLKRSSIHPTTLHNQDKIHKITFLKRFFFQTTLYVST